MKKWNLTIITFSFLFTLNLQAETKDIYISPSTLQCDFYSGKSRIMWGQMNFDTHYNHGSWLYSDSLELCKKVKKKYVEEGTISDYETATFTVTVTDEYRWAYNDLPEGWQNYCNHYLVETATLDFGIATYSHKETDFMGSVEDVSLCPVTEEQEAPVEQETPVE